MKKVKNLILGFLLVACVVACKKNETTNVAEPTITPTPTFTITNNKETMPIWVHGKTDANCILLVVQGGPGGPVLPLRTPSNSPFRTIEQQYLVAYWEQRAAGQSYSSDNSPLFMVGTFTINQYVEDLDKVVDELRSRYPNKKIALFGTSWGGMLTSSYFKDATRRAKIDGWINAAGNTDGTNMLNYSKTDINTEADARIAINENVAYWQDVKTQLQNTATNVNALAYKVIDKIPQVPMKSDISDAISTYTERTKLSISALSMEILETDNSASLTNFDKPVLILWGKYDFVVSKQIRNKALLYLNNATVTNVEMQESSHDVVFNQPNLFTTSVLNFLNSL